MRIDKSNLFFEPTGAIRYSKIYEDTVPDSVYCDGGVVGSNPSAIGGTYGIVAVREDFIVFEKAGFIPTYDHSKPIPKNINPFTNNWSEQIALCLAMEAMPEKWTGRLLSDSQVALGRVFQSWATNNLPENIKSRTRNAVTRLGMIVPILIKGHPNKEDLQKGISSKNGLPVSRFNVLCDELCNEMSKIKLQNL